jgi:hypothetical protein
MEMTSNREHFAFLAKLAAYFLVLGLVLFAIFTYVPSLLRSEEAAAAPPSEITQTLIEGLLKESGHRPALQQKTFSSLAAVLFVLSFSFACTVALMVPITWVYMHTHRKSFGRNLIASLIVLPICATATVWLIQDSLPLAFGLAALVAAVRFRIKLENELDGVYVFAAIAVGLASGVGHFGVGFVTSGFFCFIASIIWMVGYGKRPRDAEEAGAPAGAPAVAAADGDQGSGSGRQKS